MSALYEILYRDSSRYGKTRTHKFPYESDVELTFSEHWLSVKNIVGKVVFAVPRDRVIHVSIDPCHPTGEIERE